uniref:Uncharacterized protein n=1 Tax=Timema bartmani TaxID=61472 RepID=A0A7R9F704_9NEOP|nr:unnamed protein product [Timema bartmani]
MEYSFAVCSRESERQRSLATTAFLRSSDPVSTGRASGVCPCQESLHHDSDQSLPSQLVGPMLDPQARQELLEGVVILLRPAMEVHSIPQLPDRLHKHSILGSNGPRHLGVVLHITQDDGRDLPLGFGSRPRTTSTRLGSEPSKEMKAAMKVLNDSLVKPQSMSVPNHVKSATSIIQQEWFQIL